MPIARLTVDSPAPRLDRYLADRCPELSRAQARRLIDAGQALVNGASVKASQSLSLGDVVRVEIPDQAPVTPQPEDLPLDVVYEDAHLAVIAKPAGLVVHPAPGHPRGTLVNALLARYPSIESTDLDPQRPGIVHRLDRDTSGLLVVALTPEAQQALQRMFKARAVTKRYLALVHGIVERSEAAIEAPLGRDPLNRRRMAVVLQGGRPARTEFAVRESLATSTLLDVLLVTGRTHQIRVHLASIGHPVVGDRVYGPRKSRLRAPRQMLHAWQLALAHPITGDGLACSAPLPADMQTLLDRLRGSL